MADLDKRRKSAGMTVSVNILPGEFVQRFSHGEHTSQGSLIKAELRTQRRRSGGSWP